MAIVVTQRLDDSLHGLDQAAVGCKDYDEAGPPLVRGASFVPLPQVLNRGPNQIIHGGIQAAHEAQGIGVEGFLQSREARIKLLLDELVGACRHRFVHLATRSVPAFPWYAIGLGRHCEQSRCAALHSASSPVPAHPFCHRAGQARRHAGFYPGLQPRRRHHPPLARHPSPQRRRWRRAGSGCGTARECLTVQA